MHQQAGFIDSAKLDKRGPYARERRRQLEIAGLFPPRIRLSIRRNVWPLAEIEVWERAKIAGASESQVRELIRGMVAARRHGMPQQVTS